MNKNIEDVINRWKNELDNQVERFDKSAETLKNFENTFQKRFEMVIYNNYHK
jgi:hypothetical protein